MISVRSQETPGFDLDHKFEPPPPSGRAPYPRVIELGDKQLVDTATAQVTLAEIPFVSLRHGLPEALLKGRASYNETVDAARRSLGPAELIVDLRQRGVSACGTRFRMAPAQLALLALFARRLRQGENAIGAPAKDVPDMEWAARYLAELRAIAGPMGDIDVAEHALRNGMDGNYFSTTLSRLREVLKQHLGGAMSPFLIDDGGCRPRRYSLRLPASAITLLE